MSAQLLDHLPDAAAELAACADITITLHDRQLPLHTPVLASGSRVLRQALCGDASSGGADAKAAAVQHAFEGHALAEAVHFLMLLYNTAAAGSLDDPTELKGVTQLADKLDAPAVLQACERRLLELLAIIPVNRPDFQWAEWTVFADRYGLQHLLPAVAEKTLLEMTCRDRWKEGMQQLDGLRASTYQMLMEAALVCARNLKSSRANTSMTANFPSNFAQWAKPGDFF